MLFITIISDIGSDKEVDLIQIIESMENVLVREMMDYFDRIDINKDGEISFNEFIRNNNDQEGVSMKKLRRAFKNCDINGDGRISRLEFYELIKNIKSYLPQFLLSVRNIHFVEMYRFFRIYGPFQVFH